MEKSNNQKKIEVKVTDLAQPCSKKAEVKVPAETVKSELNTITREYALQASIPGFRPGKAPLAMIQKRYADNINQEFIRQVHIIAFDQLREECETELVTMPVPESAPVAPKAGEDYSFSVTFEVAPELKLPKYKGIKLKKNEASVSEEEVESEIERYRDMYSDFGTVDSPAEEGDMLKISFTSNLEEIEDAPAAYTRLVKSEDSWCWLNDPEMIPGIIKGLKGAKKGDTKKLKVEFPADFTEPLLSEKKAEYEITVLEVQRKTPLKDDNELAKRLNVKNIDELRNSIKLMREARIEQEGRADLEKQALEIIAKEVGKFDIPSTLFNQVTQSEFRQIANELVKTQEDVEEFKKNTDDHRKKAEEKATERLTNYFIAKAINQAEDMVVGEEDINEYVKGISAAYGYKEKDLRQQLESNGGYDDIHISLTIAKAANFIIDNADYGKEG